MSPTPSVGTRIQVMGMTCSGKSTLAERLSAILDLPYTDLDALYWLPGWVGREDADWHPDLRTLAEGDRWVVSGNYFRHTRDTLWPRLDTIVWLDLPLRVLLPRIFLRSWRRYRSTQLLWGTNTEVFWDHLKLWDPEVSLFAYALQGRKRQDARLLAAMADPALRHLRFVRLRSVAEVGAFVQAIERATHG